MYTREGVSSPRPSTNARLRSWRATVDHPRVHRSTLLPCCRAFSNEATALQVQRRADQLCRIYIEHTARATRTRSERATASRASTVV